MQPIGSDEQNITGAQWADSCGPRRWGSARLRPAAPKDRSVVGK